jgi:hypothetical protein
MTTIFGFFKLIDKLFEFIEFGRPDILKRNPECVPFDPLHSSFIDRNRFLCAGNDQSHTDHFAGVYFEVAIEPGASDREVESHCLNFMGIPQQKSLQLCRYSPVLPSFHVIPEVTVSRAIQERYGLRRQIPRMAGLQNSITEA